MNEYQKSLNFWDQYFIKVEGYKVSEKFITNDVINSIFNDHLTPSSIVLDYGCGSGWGLIEMALTKPFLKGIGIDASSNSVRLANDCAKLSGLDHLITFYTGYEEKLEEYPETFDFVFSTNVLDVVPDEITFKILDAFLKTVKPKGYLLICLNPQFTEKEMIDDLKMEKRGNYFFKDDILRSNHKSLEEWEHLFSSYFTLIKSEPFKFFDGEKYERRLFLLKNKA